MVGSTLLAGPEAGKNPEDQGRESHQRHRRGQEKAASGSFSEEKDGLSSVNSAEVKKNRV